MRLIHHQQETNNLEISMNITAIGWNILIDLCIDTYPSCTFLYLNYIFIEYFKFIISLWH